MGTPNPRQFTQDNSLCVYTVSATVGIRWHPLILSDYPDGDLSELTPPM